jgi:uncharacterized ubiquitin-like protein YukD
MKIVLQSLKQIKYEVELADESSVLDLKKQIELKHGFEHSVLKLLHKGKILEDQKLLSDYPLNDGTPLIIMNVKAKATNITLPNKTEEEKKIGRNKKPYKYPNKPNKQSHQH